MFVLLITYLVPLERIDDLLADHSAYLDRGYADGTFLLSGRQVPRTGGVILARAESRAAIEAILAEDPFVVHGAATYTVVEVAPSKAAEALGPGLAAAGVGIS